MTTTGPSTVALVKGHIPLVVNDSARDYVFDTGANLSTIMRSGAAAVGLRIVPAGIDVGTSTTARITADLGIADSLRIGAMHFHNVVFLVLDDALLTFPDGFRIPGIIGFPVIEQMGEIHLSRSGLSVPAAPPSRTQQNLVLDELTLLTPVRWQSRPLLCRLDTGAGRTQVYEPFYRRYREVIDAGSDTATRRMGSAGGIEQTPVRVAPNVRLTVGDTVASLKTLDVLVHSIARDESSNYLDCNLGHDVFDQFGETIVNFRDMAFLLR
jgi:Aspartyl protease